MSYGILHLHTEHSIKESVIRIDNLIQKAVDMDIKELAITDFGTMTGVFEFINKCKNNGIKPIVGLDAYVGTKENYHSVVLLAKNHEGYKEINKALVEGNKNLLSDETKIDKPIISYKTLEEYCGNGNVIALSSGLKGVPASIILSNEEIQARIDTLNKEIKKYASPEEEGYKMNLAKIEGLEKELSIYEKREAELKKLAGKSFKKPLSALESLRKTEPELYTKKKEQLDKEMKESEKAKKDLSDLKTTIQEVKKLKNTISRKVKSTEKTHTGYYEVKEKIDQLTSQLLSDVEIDRKLESSLSYFKKLFEDDYYIEIGYHGYKSEEKVIKTLKEKAEKLNIELVICNEPYMIEQSELDIREIMVSLQTNKWKKLDKQQAEYYIKTDEELKNSLDKVLDDKSADKAFINISRIAEKCNFTFPDEKHYPKYIENGEKVSDAAEVLRQKVREGIVNRGFNKETFTDTYRKRVNYELDVIIKMGFADYLLIVQDFIQYGKKLAKENNEYKLGYGIGPGRGSAAGSLVCYFLGITNIDPLPYNLKFERFLNVERVTMPDIDTDFSAEIRMKCAEYVSEKYGRESVAFIRTSSTQKAKAAVRNVTRILSSKYFGDPKYLLSLGNKIAGVIPVKDTKAKLCNYKDDIMELKETSEYGKYIDEIYETALKVEGLMTGLGVHAAGVIIGDGNPLSDYVPLLYNEDMNVWAVQTDMVESEEAGLLKMDFLGLKNLDVMSETIRRIKKYTGKEIDLDNLPFEDDVFEHIFSEGRTSSVFQFESAGMREMLRKFKPSSFEDIILLVAAYRPGPMDFIPKIIESKHGESEPYYCVPELKDILAPTYGYPIYQEQLMDIFAICAGFTQGEADVVRRNMSKKKVEKFLEAKPQFIQGLINRGAKDTDAEELWESLVSFSAYAFNKSHAAAYAKIAYQTAYLKYYYKDFYMCSVLNTSDVKKYENLLYECKEADINVLLPDINRSGFEFENTPDGILYGLGKIKSVKNQVADIIRERKENGPFRSYKDYIRRCRPKKKLNQCLIDAGCFDCFAHNMRRAYEQAYDSVTRVLNNIDSCNNRMAKEEEKLKNDKLTDYQKKKCHDNIARYKEELSLLEKEYVEYIPNVDVQESEDKLNLEHNMLCAYISAHPLDAYRDAYKRGKIRLIADFEKSEASYIGMIRNLRIAKRKSDGSEMAFFDLEDISGTLQVCCYTKEYAKYGSFIAEGAVLEIYAKGIEEDGNDDEIIEKLIVRGISKVKVTKSPIFLSVKNRADEVGLYNICKDFSDENGHPVILHYQNTGEIVHKKMSVKRDVLEKLAGKYYGKALFDYKKLDYTSKTPY